MDNFNKLLKRQIANFFSEKDLLDMPKLAECLALINNSYKQYENEYRILERTQELSSYELFTTNNKLKEETDKQNLVLTKLKESLLSLDEVQFGYSQKQLSDIDLLSITDKLSQLIIWRKRAEKKLRQSEANTSALIENTDDIIFSVDQLCELVTFNSSFINAYSKESGKTPEVGMDFLELIPKPNQKLWKEQLNRGLLGEQFSVEIGDLLSNDIGQYEVFFNPIYSEDKQINGVSVFCRDITVRKKIELQLQKSEETFRFSYQNHMLAMADTRMDTKFSRVNKAFCKLIGYSKTELLKMSISDINKGHSFDDSTLMLNKLARKEIAHFYIEKEYIKKDGTILLAKVFVVGRYDDNEKMEGTWATLEDITEARKNEVQLAKVVEGLTKANGELGDFAHIISHDLKAPLRAIGSLAHWVREDNKDQLGAESTHNLELINGRVARMYKQIDGILEYSRIGKQEDVKELIDLHKIIEVEVLDLLSPPNNVKIKIDNQLPSINTSRVQMVQLFQNLIGNAINFVDKDIGQINIGSEDEDSQWKFYVRDNGIGIDEKYHARIFGIFQTLTPRDENESTGIGLTIVKKIIEQHKGKIWLESTLGQGAIFWFSIPKNILSHS